MEQENSEEIIGFQEREDSLKLKVTQAEEKLTLLANRRDLMRLVNLSCSMTQLFPEYCSQENHQKIDQLTEQLYATAQQKDSISLQLNAEQEKNDQLHHQVANLQMVLEEFQKGLKTIDIPVCICYV